MPIFLIQNVTSSANVTGNHVIKVDKDEAGIIHGRSEKCTQNFRRKTLKEEGCFRDFGSDGRIILN
jgi:hypothetical protein